MGEEGTTAQVISQKRNLENICHHHHIKPQQFQPPLSICWCQHHKKAKKTHINASHLQNEFNSKCIFGNKWEERENFNQIALSGF